jgi:hypothetical protein
MRRIATHIAIERHLYPGSAIVHREGPTHQLRREIGPTHFPVLITQLSDDWLLA